MELPSLEQINSLSKNTLMEHWDIKFTYVSESELWATMPVNNKVKQPYGLLHGGASAALAETVGSTGSALYVDPNKYMVVGINLTAHHLRSATEGLVTAKGKIVHQGRTTHLWDIDIYNDAGKLVSSCRLTNFIKERK
ncbi:PaaI family thioesterase [Luteibaculum oceani]|uniref:PaaI family thioesterase n=1 Tax=Luteibaculum oceani TaxID=1294296 RepID=A0A5C6VEG3_9FLAO|nr:PaaI family thioesterase [Luteibaculum oceani]TXC81508.1 PaaI family thioesterase [Luteibaculum oceani]